MTEGNILRFIDVNLLHFVDRTGWVDGAEIDDVILTETTFAAFTQCVSSQLM